MHNFKKFLRINTEHSGIYSGSHQRPVGASSSTLQGIYRFDIQEPVEGF